MDSVEIVLLVMQEKLSEPLKQTLFLLIGLLLELLPPLKIKANAEVAGHSLLLDQWKEINGKIPNN